MPASYPAGFDTMSDPSTNLSGPPLHSTMHNQINDVVEAIEAELGLNPSGVAATVAANTASTAWTAVAGGVGFVNSWVDFGAPYQAVQYRKIGDIVYIRGACKSGTATTAIFTLPAGFRPPADLQFGNSASSVAGTFTVSSAGVVTHGVGPNPFIALNCQFSTI